MIRMIALLLVLAQTASAEEIVAGLSQNNVSITASFDGSEILIYGAVKRDAPAPTGPPLQVIVTVEGPTAPLIVRRKEYVAGIWLNRASVRIDSAPSFYAVATTAPLKDILSGTEDLRNSISIPRAIRAVGISDEATDAPEFVAALQRIRMSEDRYRLDEGSVQLSEATLFRADVELPANLTEGDYTVRIFLTRGGKVVDHLDHSIGVRKAGLERLLFRMAQDQPLLYGVISLLMAVVAGWAASAAFRRLRY